MSAVSLVLSDLQGCTDEHVHQRVGTPGKFHNACAACLDSYAILIAMNTNNHSYT